MSHFPQEFLHGNISLGQSLQEGSPGFFMKYLSAEPHAGLHLSREMEDKVRKLAAMIGKET